VRLPEGGACLYICMIHRCDSDSRHLGTTWGGGVTVTSLVVLSRIDTRAWRSPFILSLPAILSSRIGESCIYIDSPSPRGA
jgi:hypothetical protein